MHIPQLRISGSESLWWVEFLWHNKFGLEMQLKAYQSNVVEHATCNNNLLHRGELVQVHASQEDTKSIVHRC